LQAMMVLREMSHMELIESCVVKYVHA